jgi:PPP family 3-phenylpropionic acid transporter
VNPSPNAAPSADAAIRKRERSLLSVRILYFIFFAAQGVYFTFVNVYFRDIGLSGAQIGGINTIGPLVAMFSGALWGMLSDRFGRTRLLLMAATAGVMATVLLLSTATTFGAIVPVVGMFALFASAIMPLVDSTALALLGDRRDRYGSLRIWGSIGFILTSSIIGAVVARAGLHSIFYGYAGFMALHLVALLGLPNQAVRLGGSMLRGLSGLIRQPSWLVFSASVLLIGIAGNGMGNFLSVTVKAMGGPDMLVGLAWTVAAASELPVMAYSARLLGRFGAPRLLAFAFAMYAARMVLYSVMPSPYWVLFINLLGGASFALYWIAAVTYASQLAPDSLKATSQGLLMAVMNLSGVIGSTFSGLLFDAAGPSGMFRVLALFSATAFVLFVGGRWAIRRGQP